MSPAGRLLDVNAYTTLDLVDASARGPDWAEGAPAVVDVSVPERDPETVVLDVELDGGSLACVDPHADRVSLTREQARTLAEALLEASEGPTDPDRGGRNGR